jgi:UDPglucose 6-dehydrogenase
VVRAFDPVAMGAAREMLPNVTYCADPYEAAAGADAIALVTEWNVFKRLDLSRVQAAMRTPILVDGRNLYDAAEMTALGFTYVGTGTSSVPSHMSISSVRAEEHVRV